MSNTANQIDQDGRIESLAAGLKLVAEKLESAPTIDLAGDGCKQSRLLFSAFEEESIWSKKVDEDSRDVTLGALADIFAVLEKQAPQLCVVDRLQFVRIRIAIAERIELTKFSTFEVIRDRLEEYASRFDAVGG